MAGRSIRQFIPRPFFVHQWTEDAGLRRAANENLPLPRPLTLSLSPSEGERGLAAGKFSSAARLTIRFWLLALISMFAAHAGCRPSSQAVVEEVGPVERNTQPSASPTPQAADPADAKPTEADVAPDESVPASPDPTGQTAKDSWVDLFDGQSLGKWSPTKFGGEGDVLVEDGRIILEFGQPLTGITYQGQDLPTTDYELRLEATRIDGSDFFCALTFPVHDSHCSFVVGGWGGAVVGISSIDGVDASDNDTTSYRSFKQGTPYMLRVRVTDQLLEAWIDDEQVVNQELEDRIISTRPEVDLAIPLGISSFDTKSALRKIQLRKLKP